MIFIRHAPAVRRFLRDLLRDDALADEGTQETFVRAHARLATIESADALAGWLFGIARMVSLEQHRRVRARREEPETDRVQIDRAPGPEAVLLSAESDRVLNEAMQSLSEERRAALLMRVDHDLGYGEIAAAMGWPLQKVKNEIHRARLQLRERLQPYLEARL